MAPQAAEFAESFPEELLLLSVDSEGSPVGAALSTPPHNLILSRQSAEAVDALVGFLAGSIVLPGVIGPDDVPDQFA